MLRESFATHNVYFDLMVKVCPQPKKITEMYIELTLGHITDDYLDLLLFSIKANYYLMNAPGLFSCFVSSVI